MTKFSILDYAVLDEGKTCQDAYYESLELAKLADELDYHRFWLAEHHNVPALTSSSPEIMIMHYANKTKKIRLGTGGVMLPHYSPYKVAEVFKTLETFFPNRIDLGIGNNIGTEIVQEVLNENKTDFLNYQESLKDLLYYAGKSQQDHRFQGITAHPICPSFPPIHVLSLSQETAKVAAQLGLGYVFGQFLLPNALEVGKEIAQVYREEFQANQNLAQPYFTLAIFVVVDETDEAAEKLAQTLDVWLLGKERFSEFKAFPSITTAEAYTYSKKDRKQIDINQSRRLVGSAQTVAKELKVLIEHYKADEVLLTPLVPTIEKRKLALSLLAKELKTL